MKNLIYKILGVLGLLFTFFRLGKRSGKTALKNEINKQTLKDVKKSKTINEEVDNMSNSDLDDLLRK